MKNLKLILSGLSLFLFIQGAISQPICGFDGVHGKKLSEDPVYRDNILANEARIQNYIQAHKNDRVAKPGLSKVSSALYTIPVVVHVVHTGGAIGTIYNPTDAQITGAINYLNQVYNGTYPGIEGVGDLQVQFALATKDPNCNTTTGIDRIDGSGLTNYASNGVNSSTSGGVSDLNLKNFDRWDPANYYNIWVVNKIDAKDGTAGQFVAGYAYFAGASSSVDGTVMLATQMATGKKTLPHEIGHALNLYHPFEGSPDAVTCPANTDCTTDGDKVCDTDPITYNQTGGIVDFTCRAGTNSCNGAAYSINTEKNYMNYTSCYTLFTAGQKSRMLAAMSLPSRASLVSSWSLGGAYPVTPYTAPVAASCTPVTGATGLSGYYAGIMNVAVSNKSFFSGPAKDDGGYLDKTNQCLYLIPMQRNNTYTFSASLLGANDEQIRVWIDYNNDGVFSNATEQVYYNANALAVGGGNFVNVSTTFTVPATATTNVVLRMRVQEEVAAHYGFTINGACYNPTYGQTEDYPVFLTSALPVTLEYFKSIKQNNDALLTWKTSFEQDSKEFRIEKSTDGSTFTDIGTVPASNNSAGSAYSFTDKNISGPANYYRLKQVDLNGKSELSEIVIIKTGDDIAAKLKILSNPFTDQLQIVLNGSSASAAINLFDIAGRKVYQKNFKASVSTQQVNIDLSGFGLKPGVYILQVKMGDWIYTEKLIKQ